MKRDLKGSMRKHASRPRKVANIQKATHKGSGPRTPVAQRVERVKRALIRGDHPEEIARREGVVLRTIQKDIAKMKKAGIKYLDEVTVNELVSESHRVYLELERVGWIKFQEAEAKFEARRINAKTMAILQGIAQDKVRMARLALDALYVKVGLFRPAPTTSVNIVQVFERLTPDQWTEMVPKLLDWFRTHPEDVVAVVEWALEERLVNQDILSKSHLKREYPKMLGPKAEVLEGDVQPSVPNKA